MTVFKVLSGEGLLWWRKSRIHSWKLPPPMAVLWDLTSRCNLSCRHCVVSAGSPNPGELGIDTCRRLIDEMAGFGVQQLILSGGEPLLRPDFFEIAEYAHKRGLSLQIATNATIVTRDVARRLKAIGACVQASLDSIDPVVHDELRQCKGSWKRAVKGIKLLVKNDVPVTIAALVTKNTIAQIPELYDFSAELGVQTFRILPFVPSGRGSRAKDMEVSPVEMKCITEYLARRRNDVGLPVAPMEFECTLEHEQGIAHPQTRIGCDGGVAYCTITSDGEVLPCNYFSGVRTENVKDTSFSWIWDNSHFLNYFRSLTVSDIHGICQGCKWLIRCRGSCLAANFTHGDIFQSNCHCWIVCP